MLFRSRDDNYLSVCRLVPYKRVDLVVQACSRLGLPLLVVGDGPDRRRLEALAGPSVRFLGRCPADEVARLMGRCRAFLYAGVEDFGIAPVEAMAAGAPVVALGVGGLRDSVRCLSDDPATATGLFFSRQTVDDLVAALRHFEEGRLWRQLPAERLRRHAERFAPDRFRDRLAQVLQAWMADRPCA